MTCSPPGSSIHGISQARNTGVGCHSASYMALVVKNPPANAEDVRDAGSIPGSGRSLEEDVATHSRILTTGMAKWLRRWT